MGVQWILVVPRDYVGKSTVFWHLLVHLAQNVAQSGCAEHKHRHTGSCCHKREVTEMYICFLSCVQVSFFFAAGISLRKCVRKMPKSGISHADAIGFWGHIHVMQWRKSLQLGNKMLCVFSTAVEVPVKFQSNRTQISRLRDFTRSSDLPHCCMKGLIQVYL